MPVPQVVQMNNFFCQYLQVGCFQSKKISKVFISTPYDHRDWGAVRFFLNLSNHFIVGSFETWDEQARFYLSRYFALACRKSSHFNSQVVTLDFTWNCCRFLKAKNFSRNPGQFRWVIRETRHFNPSRNSQNGISEPRLFQRPRTMLKILKFQWGPPIFPKITGDKVSLWPGRKPFIYLLGRHNLGRGRHF